MEQNTIHSNIPTGSKSEELTTQQLASFKRWVASQRTIVRAAAKLEVQRHTVVRALKFGSAHPDTIKKILTAINA